MSLKTGSPNLSCSSILSCLLALRQCSISVMFYTTTAHSHVRVEPKDLKILTMTDISRLTPMQSWQTADAIWLEIHHEAPGLAEGTLNKRDGEGSPYTTLCFRGFISVTTHGYATVELSECFVHHHHEFSAHTAVQIYGLLSQDPRLSSRLTLNAPEKHHAGIPIQTTAKRRALTHRRVCPKDLVIFNATLCSTSPAVFEVPSTTATVGVVS